jgi:hypothetical protein
LLCSWRCRSEGILPQRSLSIPPTAGRIRAFHSHPFSYLGILHLHSPLASQPSASASISQSEYGRRYGAKYSRLTTTQDSTFFLGSAKRYLSEPFGVPNLEWESHISEGLYRMFLGPVTVLVATSQSSLITILGKNNVCVKPEVFSSALNTIIGRGLVTAEGEEHKVGGVRIGVDCANLAFSANARCSTPSFEAREV